MISRQVSADLKKKTNKQTNYEANLYFWKRIFGKTQDCATAAVSIWTRLSSIQPFLFSKTKNST